MSTIFSMGKPTLTCAILAVGLLMPIHASAQTSGSPSHLVEIGVASSLHSEILQEQRDIWIHLPNGGVLIVKEHF